MNKFDEKIVSEIKASLNLTESMVDAKVPDMSVFRDLILQADCKKQSKNRRDTIIFVLIAAVALSIETFAFNQSIVFFIALQGMAFTSFLICILSMYLRTRRKVKA